MKDGADCLARAFRGRDLAARILDSRRPDPIEIPE